MTSDRDVFKILRSYELAAFIQSGVFAGSSDDLRDGFIHLSAIEQIVGTLDKHFKNETDLYLIGVDRERVERHLRWETSGAGKSFPHLYEPLTMGAVTVIIPINADTSENLPNLVLGMASNASK